MEITTYSNNEGNFIRGRLLDTRLNERNWRLANTGDRLTQLLNQKVPGTNFMIDASKLQKGIDAHYYGDGTKADILKGYSDFSHGKYIKVLGPFADGPDNTHVYYDFIVQLNGSRAASALLKHGSQSIIPFAVSPHIWPLEGPDDNIRDFDFLGGALVVKGAYGEKAVISKMCNGTATVCEKSLAASIAQQQEDQRNAEIISSLVSKAASIQTLTMSEQVATEVTKAPVNANPQQAPTNITLNPQEPPKVMQGAPLMLTAEQYEQGKKEAVDQATKELEKQVKALRADAKLTMTSTMLLAFKDEKNRKAVSEELELDKMTNEEVKMFIQKLGIFRKALEQENPPPPPEEKPADDNTSKAKKGKSASSITDLPKEPIVPQSSNDNNKDEGSKAASAPISKVRSISDFIRRGRA